MDSVVVLGGGYAGVKVAKLLDEVADVTLVDPTDAFVHNIAAWRALVEPEWLERIFLPYDRLLVRGRFLRDRAVAVDGREVTLASGRRLRPDHLIVATGSHYPFPAKSSEPDVATARAAYLDAHEDLLAAERVLIVGAGPAGLELAGEIKAFFPDKRVTIADVAPDILPGPFDDALRTELRRQLDEIGVELRLGAALPELPAVEPARLGEIVVGDLRADIWYRAFGVVPQTSFLPFAKSGRGYVEVDEYMRVRGAEDVYAIGDVSTLDRDMAGMAAMQAERLAANLRARLTGEGDVEPYVSIGAAIAVPLGPDGGAGQLPGMDGIAGPEIVADIKGRDMIVDRSAALFDALAPAEVLA